MNTRGVVAQIARIREQTHSLVERELEARGIEGIVPAHGSVLAFLFGQAEPVPIKAVVGKVRRVKSTVTGILNTLERHGYVRRFRSIEDQRVVCVALTEKGRALQHNFEAISATLLAKVYDDMPPTDRERLAELLTKIERNLDTNDEPA